VPDFATYVYDLCDGREPGCVDCAFCRIDVHILPESSGVIVARGLRSQQLPQFYRNTKLIRRIEAGEHSYCCVCIFGFMMKLPTTLQMHSAVSIR